MRVVLFRIGSYLSPGHRELLLEELPPALRAAVGTRRDVSLPIEERILAPGITLGRAHELVASVFRVLEERLSGELIEALRTELPHELASMLVAPSSDADRDELVPGVRDTLAEGRPGSHHPVSESALDAVHETIATGRAGSEHPVSESHRRH